MTETSYGDYVESLLVEEYGAENVERNVFLPRTYRYVDFLVETGFVTLAIELEHSTDKVVYEGYAQAELYAKHSRSWVPVIVYPPDGENEEELSMIGEDVALVPIEHKHGAPEGGGDG